MSIAEQDKITVAPDAVKYLQESIKGKSLAGIRLGVKPTGCSGFAYVMEYAYQVEDNDLLFDNNGICIIVDSLDHKKYLKGVTLKLEENDFEQGIVFDNPNSAGVCGCGESFTINNE